MHQLRPHYSATLRLGLPIAIGQIGVIVMGFADTVMVGRYATDALAASSFVNNLFMLVNFLLMGYSYGLTPLIGAAFGRNDLAEAGGIFKQALMANTLWGLLLTAVMGGLYFFIGQMGQPVEILPLVRHYYLYILVSVPFVMLFNVTRQFTDGTTDTATGMWILLTGNVINVVGNALLIYGLGGFPEMGLDGAGLATLLSRIYMAVALLVVVARHRRYAPYRQGWKAERLSRKAVADVNRLSLPVAMQMGMESGSFTCSAIMAGWLGAASLAGYQVMVTIGTLGFLFYYSLGAGLSIRVATFFGTNDWAQVRLATRAGVHILGAMALVSSLLMLVFARSLIGLFTSDAEVAGVCMTLITPLMVYQFADAMQICLANVLRAMKQVVSMMRVAFISYIIVNIPMGYALGFVLGWGEVGIFLAFSCGLYTAAVLFFFCCRKVFAAHPL